MGSEASNIWEGERVRLRGIEPSDAATFFEWSKDTYVARRAYHVPQPNTLARSERQTREWSEPDVESDDRRWLIETLNEGEPVGSMNTARSDRIDGTFWYGIAIARGQWRRGYASDAIKIMLPYYFGEMHYAKAQAEVYDFNPASIALHERLGFTMEGRLRQAVYSAGERHDSLIYGITREEFIEQHPMFAPRIEPEA